jgi:hypothetical protein
MNDNEKIVQKDDIGEKAYEGFNKFCNDNKLEKTQETYCGLYEAYGYNKQYES